MHPQKREQSLLLELRLPHQPRLPRLLLFFLVLLPLRLTLLLHLALLLALELIRPPNGNVLWLVVRERPFEAVLDEPAASIVDDHDRSDHDFEFAGEGNELELLVDLGDELGGAGEGDTRDEDETPVHAAVLADGLAERTALVVDGKGGNLLDELKEVDGRVKEGWLKFLLQIDVLFFGISALHVLRYVDQSNDVDSELAKNGADDVEVEDVVLRAFLGKRFNGL